ncbi:MAG: protein-glutamate O-methyltransferase CheR [Methanobacteriota archaeon]|nr:MAG: protein-glutamate O-methyltransferase CheR [Euryarchaeota archaeon]
MEIEDDETYNLIKRHLLNSRGFDITGYSRSFFNRSIRKRAGRTGSKSGLDYVGRLRKDDAEVNELIASLSVNVTDFFRDSDAFTVLTSRVLRPLVEKKVQLGWSALRIWSAGCATGQETYSIAICVAEELKRVGTDSDIVVRIVGTDLSPSALDVARMGFYSAERVKGVNDALLSEYFREVDSGYQVVPLLKRMIRFSKGNLLDRPTRRFLDLIVCRNVIIYFSRPMHDKVIDNFHHALRPEGYLMLGRTETLMGPRRRLFEAVDHENRIFQKASVPVKSGF